MPFGMVSGVTPCIHVLDRGPRALRGRVDFGVVCPHWPNGVNGIFCNRNVFDCTQCNEEHAYRHLVMSEI